jgi:glutaredoxin
LREDRDPLARIPVSRRSLKAAASQPHRAEVHRAEVHRAKSIVLNSGEPLRRVTLYTAPGCSLCERALEVVEAVTTELDVELEAVDISGRPELESRYRELIPVVEIGGETAFTYFVDAEALRSRLR